ncbi:MAG: fatty acid metabolism transcriptional regulator FadR [Deltaproteobacteria bacterium]|nr:fatty acid metabolism transcriptional regulator FadR [Deltaproteobacteria bacterium]
MAVEKGLPFRPAQYAERMVVTAILDGTFPPGSVLPSERVFAEELGVTRPTLREILQRLASEGWITIHHGKQTVVNNYWKEGGLRLLSTTAKYGDILSREFITNLLEVRVNLLPPVAKKAVENSPDALLEYLGKSRELKDDPEAFARYDWGLQVLIARESQNPIYLLILNDFTDIFRLMAPTYFNSRTGRKASRRYYQKLFDAIRNGGNCIEDIVREALETSIHIWEELARTQEVYNGALERMG